MRPVPLEVRPVPTGAAALESNSGGIASLNRHSLKTRIPRAEDEWSE